MKFHAFRCCGYFLLPFAYGLLTAAPGSPLTTSTIGLGVFGAMLLAAAAFLSVED